MSAEKTTDFLGHLVELSAPLDKRLIKTRKGPGGKDLDFAEWHTIVDRLNAAVPEWRFEIKNLIPMGDGDFVCHGALTIDGVTRENVGAGDGNADKGPKSAVSDCIKRCAILFGLGLELYRDNQQQAWAVKRNEIAARKIAELKAVPAPNAGPDLDAEAARTLASAPEPEPIEDPAPPKPDHIARTLSQLLTPKQTVAIRAIANKAGADAEKVCYELFECRPEELTKDAASKLIEHLRGLAEPAPPASEPVDDERRAAFDAQAPGENVEADRRDKKGRALAVMGHVSRSEEGFEVTTAGRRRETLRVWRDADGRVKCSCAEFGEADDPRYRCEHILAVKYYLEPPAPAPEVERISNDQKATLTAMWEACHLRDEDWAEFEDRFRVDTMSALRASDVESALTWMKDHKRKK